MKRIFYEKIRGFRDENFRQALSVIPNVDHSNLRKRIVVTSLFAGLMFTASSFTFGPVDDAVLVDNTPQKKEQRVKVVVRKDGKETKIDTTFNLPNEKMINLKVDSILKNLDVEGIESGKSNIVIHRGEKAMHWNHHNGEGLPGEEQFDILVQSGDSGKVMHKRKIFRFGEGNDALTMGDDEGDNLIPPPPPPPPPMPPFPFEYQQRFNGDPFALDPNDDAIISYDKKDIGKGLEKITIIRKKQVKHDLNKDVKVHVDVSDDSKK
jgi:hypothetical protein